MISHTGELPAFTWPAGADRRPSRVVVGIAAAVVVAVIAWTTWSWPRESAATAAPAPPPPTSGFVASIGRRASHGGRYHAEVVAFTPFATGVRQSWVVSLTRRGHRRVSGARLTVRTWAPETRAVSPIVPSARYVGGGRYRIDGIYFPRPGWWNVALVIDATTGTDSLAFNVVMPAASAPVSSASLSSAHAGATQQAAIGAPRSAPAPVTPASVPRVGATPPIVAVVADSAGTEITDFMIPRATLTESGVTQVVTVAPHLGAIHLWPGTVTIDPDMTLAAFDAAHPTGADYVIVPALVDRDSPVIAAWLHAQAARGATIVAICDGAWTVANAGLLTGHRATGHWHSLEGLAKKYPGATWVRDRRYVVDDRVITTSGVSASLPASLMLVERIGSRAAAEATARRIGVASWSDAHRTSDFAVTKGMYVTGAANAVAWWRHDVIAVPVADGVDEIALALTVDAIPRTMRGRPFTWSASGGTVTGRQGLRVSVDGARSDLPANAKEIRLPAPSSPPAGALDSAITTLDAWYGPGAARLITTGMEYPRPARRKSP